MTKQPHTDPTYADIVWAQFRKRRLAFGSLMGLFCLFAVAVLAPLFISNMPFVWRVDEGPFGFPWLVALFVRNQFESALDVVFNALLFPGLLFALVSMVVWRKTRRLPPRMRRQRRIFAFAAIWTVLFCFMTALLFWPFSKAPVDYSELREQLHNDGHHVLAIYPLIPYSFRAVDLDNVRAPPSLEHFLGTDSAGRDVFARLVYGTRISLTVGIFAVALTLIIGVFIGSVAGYYGGRVDAVMLRLIEVTMSIPSLFLILTLAAFIEKRSVFHIMGIIAVVGWTTPARLVRAEFLRLRGLDFVAAAMASGFRESTVIVFEILPNALGPVLVTATFGVASAILTESTMSFLGLGDITVPSWGQILNTGRTSGMWTLILAPGLAIFITVSLLNLLGEGLRDALDPKLRR